MERKIKRGDMYYAKLMHGVGSEQSGLRPVLIVQNDTGNKHSGTVIVAPITSKTDRKYISLRIAVYRRCTAFTAFHIFCWSNYIRLINHAYSRISER